MTWCRLEWLSLTCVMHDRSVWGTAELLSLSVVYEIWLLSAIWGEKRGWKSVYIYVENPLVKKNRHELLCANETPHLTPPSCYTSPAFLKLYCWQYCNSFIQTVWEGRLCWEFWCKDVQNITELDGVFGYIYIYFGFHVILIVKLVIYSSNILAIT